MENDEIGLKGTYIKKWEHERRTSFGKIGG